MNINEQQDLENLSEQYKQQIFSKFITLKLAFRKILHKKIVHKILHKFIDSIFQIDFLFRDYGTNPEKIKQLSIELQKLVKITQLEIVLSTNKLGKHPINLEYLYHGFKSLVNLKTLYLNLQNNSIGNLEYIFKTFKHFKQLNQLDLYLDRNKLSSKPEQFVLLFKSLSKIPHLQYLSLSMANNNLGSKSEESLNFITKGLKKLQNLTYLYINLHTNNFECEENIIRFFQAIKTLKQLNTLYIQIQIQNYLTNFEHIQTIFNKEFSHLNGEFC